MLKTIPENSLHKNWPGFRKNTQDIRNQGTYFDHLKESCVGGLLVHIEVLVATRLILYFIFENKILQFSLLTYYLSSV